MQKDVDVFANWLQLWHLSLFHGECHVLHINFRLKYFIKLGGQVFSTIDSVHGLC